LVFIFSNLTVATRRMVVQILTFYNECHQMNNAGELEFVRVVFAKYCRIGTNSTFWTDANRLKLTSTNPVQTIPLCFFATS